MVRIFLHSDWIRRDTPYLSVFSPNVGKYGPEKLQIRTLFTQYKYPAFFIEALIFIDGNIDWNFKNIQNSSLLSQKNCKINSFVWRYFSSNLNLTWKGDFDKGDLTYKGDFDKVPQRQF